MSSLFKQLDENGILNLFSLDFAPKKLRGFIRIFAPIFIISFIFLLFLQISSSLSAFKLDKGLHLENWAQVLNFDEADYLNREEREQLDREFPLPEKFFENESRVTFSTTIPKTNLNYPALIIPNIKSEFFVYIEGEKVYEYSSLYSIRSPWRKHLIPLKPDYAGKTLVIDITSYVNISAISYPKKIILEEFGKALVYIIFQDLAPILISLLCITLSFICFVAIFIRKSIALYLPASVILLSSAFVIFEGAHLIAFLELEYWMLDNIWGATVATGILAMGKFFVDAMGKDSVPLTNFNIHFGYLLFITGVIEVVLFFPPFEMKMDWYSPVLFPIRNGFLIFSTLSFLYEVLKLNKQKKPEAKIFMMALFIMLIAAAHDFSFIFNFLNAEIRWVPFSTLISILIFSPIIYWPFYKITHAKTFYEEKFNHDKNVLLQELHDGIGSIATNISLLSDIGSHIKDEGKIKTLIGDIGDLSRTGLDEVRGFIQASDKEINSWAELELEANRLVKSILSPHSVPFKLTFKLYNKNARPDFSLAFHLMRIIRETTTNCLKHGDGGLFTMTLAETESKFHCQIENSLKPKTRKELHRSGVNMRKGLENIDKRIKQLNGIVTIFQNENFHLNIIIPKSQKALSKAAD